MRAAFYLFLLLSDTSRVAWAEAADFGPSITAGQDRARWADWEAQSRVTNGDYDGAVQAEQQANVERQKVERQEAGRQESRARVRRR